MYPRADICCVFTVGKSGCVYSEVFDELLLDLSRGGMSLVKFRLASAIQGRSCAPCQLHVAFSNCN